MNEKEEFTEDREGSEGEKVERCCDTESAIGSRSCFGVVHNSTVLKMKGDHPGEVGERETRKLRGFCSGTNRVTTSG